LEQLQQPSQIVNVGPDPNPIGKLYFKRSEILNRIINKMKDMAPDGIGSQHQFVEIMEQAINTINDELKRELSTDEMSDVVLTISDVERQLMFTPYEQFNLNENKVGMGEKYKWKEALMSLAKERIKETGSPEMSKEELTNLFSEVRIKLEQEMRIKLEKEMRIKLEEEIDQTLNMIFQSLTQIVNILPADKFFASL
jgi:hypothetical protein